jgi:hypothetical protein
MSQGTPEGAPAPDANASQAQPQTDVEGKPGSEADPSPAADPKPTKDGRDIRIDELTRRLRETERRYDRVLKMAESRVIAPEPVQAVKPEPVKSLKDFNYNEADFTAYLEDRVSKVADKVVETKLTEKQQKEANAKRDANYFAKAAAFAKTAEDYYEVAGSAPITDTIVELVKELEEAPLVAFHLGNNHALAEEISGLSERAAAIRLGKLEDKLVAEREKLKAKPVSQAPPPPPTLEASDPGDVDTEPNSSWSDAKFDKWRKKQIAQRK